MQTIIDPVLKSLADLTRLRMAHLLLSGELCACDIEAALTLNQSNASRHLTKLAASGLLEVEKRGLYRHYRLSEAVMQARPWVKVLLEDCADKLPFRADRQNLKAFQASKTC